jgi:hypothetical protein
MNRSWKSDYIDVRLSQLAGWVKENAENAENALKCLKFRVRCALSI